MAIDLIAAQQSPRKEIRSIAEQALTRRQQMVGYRDAAATMSAKADHELRDQMKYRNKRLTLQGELDVALASKTPPTDREAQRMRSGIAWAASSEKGCELRGAEFRQRAAEATAQAKATEAQALAIEARLAALTGA